MRKRGVTIVELLIYMGLMAGLLVIIGQILFQVLDVKLQTSTYSDVQQDGQYILARLAYDIRRASSVFSPATSGQVANNLTLVIGGVNYGYSLNGNDLQLTVAGVGQNLNSSGVSVSSFAVTKMGTATDSASIDVSFTLTSKTNSLEQKNEVRSFDEAITLR